MTKKQKPRWTCNISLHSKQLEVFRDETRFQVMVCGRRFGKSHLQVNRIIADVLRFNELMPGYDIKAQTMETVILVGMPTLKQAKKILWKPLVKLLQNSPLVESIDRTNHTIKFKGNFPEIHVVGLNDSDGDRARGLKLWRAYIDEVQDVKASVLDTVIMPALSDTPRSRGFFSGTPKGKVNHLYGLFQRELEPNLSGQWKSFSFPTSANPFIPRSEIELAKLTLSPRLYAQEFESDFVNFEGAIFSEFNSDKHVLQESQLPQTWDTFYIGHDPGDINPAIVVVGVSQKKYYILEAVQRGDGVNPVPAQTVYETIEGFCDRYGPKTYRVFVDPSRPGVIHDLRQLGTQKNIEALKRTIAGYNPIEFGNNVVNNLFYQDRLFVSAKCPQSFVDQLVSYHRAKDPRSDTVTEKVAPNQLDHLNDATRYVISSLHNQGAREQNVLTTYGAA